MDDDIIIYYDLIKKYNIDYSRLECSININLINNINEIQKKILKIDKEIKTFKNNFKKDTKKWSLNDSVNKKKVYSKLNSINVINNHINKLKNEKITYINNINDLINKINNENKIEINTNKTEISTDKIEININKTELSTDEIEINENKIEININKTEISSDEIEINENNNEDWENNIINS